MPRGMKMKRDTTRSIVMLFLFFYLPAGYLVLNFEAYKELADGLLFLSVGVILTYGTFHPKSILIKTFAHFI